MTKLIFDFDGTLVNSMPRFTTVASALIATSYDVDLAEARELYLSTVGLSFREQLDELFPKVHSRNLAVAAKFLPLQKEVYRTVELHDGVLEELELLKYYEQPFAICTSSQYKLIHPALKRTGLAELTGTVVGRELGSKQEQLSYLRGHGYTSFIGDSPKDGAIANALSGIDFMGVEHTFSRTVFKEAGLPSEVDLHEAVSRLLGRSFFGTLVDKGVLVSTSLQSSQVV